jgi:predicted site-specific integrase-resolvase
MWVKKGVIPYKRITKRIIRFDKEEIDAFMKKTA